MAAGRSRRHGARRRYDGRQADRNRVLDGNVENQRQKRNEKDTAADPEQGAETARETANDENQRDEESRDRRHASRRKAGAIRQPGRVTRSIATSSRERHMLRWQRKGGQVSIAMLNADELRSALEEHKKLTVLDVRPAAERAEWSIPGSRYVDAYAELWRGESTALNKAAADLPRDRPVVTVCAKGRTSMIAAEALDRLGFEAFSLDGGMTAWSEAWNVAQVPLTDPATEILQVRRTGKGCLSYILASESEAAVVDPAVEPSVYMNLAAKHGWNIVAVIDTHVHADHVTRAYRLAEATGAPVYLPAQRRVSRPFHPLIDGQELPIGRSRIKAISTPGHTPESMCFLFGTSALCTGDTLFLHGVGRPDLKADAKETSARAHLLYHSLIDRVLPLPDSLVVLPGHSSAALAFDGVPHADSLAHVRTAVSLATLDEETFVQTILQRIPATPANHLEIVRINEGRADAPPELNDLEAGANRCAISS